MVHPRQGRPMPGMPPGRLGGQMGGEFFADVGGALGDDLRRLRLVDPRHRSPGTAVGGPAMADWAAEFAASGRGGGGGAPALSARERAMFDGAYMAARQETAGGWASSFASGLPSAAAGIPPELARQREQQQREFERSWQTAATPHDWAEQFLQYDHDPRANQAVRPGQQLTREQLELQETARQLLAQSTDPKVGCL